MSGAALLVKLEFTRPGVPLILALGSRFWRESLGRAGLTTSIEFPKPLAALNQDQPETLSSITQRQRMLPVAGVAGVPLTVIVKVLGVIPPTTKRPLYSGWSAPEMTTWSLALKP